MARVRRIPLSDGELRTVEYFGDQDGNKEESGDVGEAVVDAKTKVGNNTHCGGILSKKRNC